ncbi:MAG: MarR family winged helix-turn-helix transcriptional regulator [Gaiellaceae bacterium]
MPEDHIDQLLARLDEAGAQLDLEVEGIVDRVSSINKRVHAALKETLVDYGITPEDWGVLTSLSLRKEGKLSSPGALARDLELSSGAVTSRLDRLESLGFVRRLPDPGDRRGVLVELTPEGRAAWESAIEVQGRKEAFFASALTKEEQHELNDLLRKLLLALQVRQAETQTH